MNLFLSSCKDILAALLFNTLSCSAFNTAQAQLLVEAPANTKWENGEESGKLLPTFHPS